MKKSLLLITTVSILLLTRTADAQAVQTNLVQSLHVNLTALFQGANVTNQDVISYAVVPSKISNWDIIQKLGAATSRTFTMAAKLLLITPLARDGKPAVVVQDGATRVDVTGFFSYDKDDVRVAKGTTNTSTGAERGTEYSIQSFRLKDDENYPDLNMHFRVRGFTQFKYVTIPNSEGEIIGEAEEYVTTAAGTADINEKSAVVRGNVSVTGRQIEIRN